MRLILLLFSGIFSFAVCNAQLMQSPDKAFDLARQTGKKVMLVFSGSDWCIPCIQFNKKILSDSSFLRYAGNNLVLLEADFPQRKKIATPLRLKYDSLAAVFNPEGAFPHVVLLSPEKQFIKDVPVGQQTPNDFINTIKQLLK
ncbi:Thioredoxin-like [Chitinophaga sp. CF118]|uniref:thioredoxin family protein n=1 Tax=Chitinophaga sp. CF118 TaxID=1884367 RepID=UPI0008EB1ADE|nr:thioredoxin family protein [Chitinophaga sp. CF118]SFE80930.1 Thioredoxin-like [Chitinophaga sp. CF118]